MPSAANPNPHYKAFAPWIGPLVGACTQRGLRIAAAADPLRGNALAAVLLPVVRGEDGKLGPAQPNAPLEGAWLGWPKSNRDGRFQVNVPVLCWADPRHAGVLMFLLYDQSGKEEAWLKRVKEDPEFKAGTAIEEGMAYQVGDLPHWAKGEIERHIAEFLRQSARQLNAALIAPDPVHCGLPNPLGGVTFAVGSCQYPAGFLDRDIAERSYRRLQRCFESKDGSLRPQCLLLVGDQIYADATAGLFDPATLYDRFELQYERLLRMEPLRDIVRRVPAYTMLDDHEITDNWEPVAGSNPADDENLINGRRYYLEYQRMAGPALKEPVDDSILPLWYDFEVNGFPFFMLDTRTERLSRTAETVENASIMSEAQFRALKEWLLRPNPEGVPPHIPKFIASASCVLPRHRRAVPRPDDSPAAALRSDGWDGYPASLKRLLSFIAEKEIRNVFFLSGDEHISFITEAKIAKKAEPRVTVYSIHSSALYAPYPFANSMYDNLAETDTYDLGTYSCGISTRRAPAGDGFTLLRASHENGKWCVRCRFSRDGDNEKQWIDVN